MFWKIFATTAYWLFWSSIWWSSDSIPNDGGYLGMIGFLTITAFLMAVFVAFWNAAVTSGNLYPQNDCPWIYLDRIAYVFLLIAIFGHLVVMQFNIMHLDLMTLFCLFMGFHVAKFFLWSLFACDQSSVSREVLEKLRDVLGIH